MEDGWMDGWMVELELAGTGGWSWLGLAGLVVELEVV